MIGRTSTVILSIGLLLFSALVLSIHLPPRLNGQLESDFANYYFGGKRLRESRPLYDPLHEEVAQAVGIFHDAPLADTPLLVTLVSPLSYISFFEASVLLLVLSTVLFVLTIGNFCKRIGLSSSAKLFALSVAISSGSFQFLLLKNHIEVILLVLSIAGFFLMQRKRLGAAGFVWGLAGALKLFPLFWIVGCANYLGRRGVAAGISTFIVGSLIPLCFVSLENYRTFFAVVIPGAERYIGAAGNYSLASFGAAIWNIEYTLAFILLGTLYVLLRIVRSNQTVAQAWGAAVCGSLILTPLSWLNYFILVLPVMVLMFAEHKKGMTFSMLIFSIVLWNFPPWISTGEYYTTVIISFLPLFALLYLFRQNTPTSELI